MCMSKEKYFSFEVSLLHDICDFRVFHYVTYKQQQKFLENGSLTGQIEQLIFIIAYTSIRVFLKVFWNGDIFGDRCFLQQLLNFWISSSSLHSLTIHFELKKNKTHLQSFPLAQCQFYISWCAQFCIWKGMCLLSAEQCVILFSEEVSDLFHCLVVLT